MALNVRPVMEQKLYLINHRYQQPGLPCGVRYPERLISTKSQSTIFKTPAKPMSNLCNGYYITSLLDA
jgi:hypothetical protein